MIICLFYNIYIIYMYILYMVIYNIYGNASGNVTKQYI